MVYIVLAVGMILTIYELIKIKKDENVNTQEKNIIEFKNILSDNIILNRLDSLEEKMDEIKSMIEKDKEKEPHIQYDIVNTQLNIHQEVMDDLNRQIYMMKDSGMDVEDIADRLGIKKGEILLRLGMRK